VWVVIGLGNPGRQYAESRHNAGFMVVKRLWKRWRFPEWKKKFRAKLSSGFRGEEEVFLVMPQTYMNRSGEAVALLVSFFKLPPDHLLVIYDDLDLPLGSLRIRRAGGPGTHRGMQSVVETLGREDFPRIRIGIGPLPEEAEAAQFVLEPFTPQEKEKLRPCLEAACEATEMILDGAIDQAMNLYNRQIV
jgi:PTH1 family peptidyl-tRNA hydrolase